MTTYLLNNEHTGVLAGIASLIASLVAGMACIGPLAGILLGVGGLGWLSQYAWLTFPAALTSLLLLSIAIIIYSKRRTSCANRRKHIMNRILLIATAVAVIGINVFEFFILPIML